MECMICLFLARETELTGTSLWIFFHSIGTSWSPFHICTPFVFSTISGIGHPSVFMGKASLSETLKEHPGFRLTDKGILEPWNYKHKAWWWSWVRWGSPPGRRKSKPQCIVSVYYKWKENNPVSLSTTHHLGALCETPACAQNILVVVATSQINAT